MKDRVPRSTQREVRADPQRTHEERPPNVAALNLPRVQPAEFERNFVLSAVCELRFPTLLEIETKSPASVQKALRKDYPAYDRKRRILANVNGKIDSEVQHEFRDKTANWLVAFRPSAVALETTGYTNFEDFLERLERAVAATKREIESDFFTRIGLRYINRLAVDEDKIDGWVNPDLVGPVSDGTYGTVTKYMQEIRGYLPERGAYTFRHGFPDESSSPRLEYILDFDLYDEAVEVDRALDVVSFLHQFSYQFFLWAIGPKTLRALGRPTPKSAKV